MVAKAIQFASGDQVGDISNPSDSSEVSLTGEPPAAGAIQMDATRWLPVAAKARLAPSGEYSNVKNWVGAFFEKSFGVMRGRSQLLRRLRIQISESPLWSVT